MSRIQTLRTTIGLFFLTSLAAASDCLQYSFYGTVIEKDNVLILALNPDSRSEIKIELPPAIQIVLKPHLGHRIQLESPAQKINAYLYKSYFIDGKVNSYPFSAEPKDKLDVIDANNNFACEPSLHKKNK